MEFQLFSKIATFFVILSQLVKKSLFVGIVSFLFIALLCSLNLVYF